LAYRAVYCVKYLDTVFVLHAFVNMTNAVDRKQIATAAKRYKEMMRRVDAARRSAAASKLNS
jgi:phage-related protein